MNDDPAKARPADGERNAILGYSAHYHIAAELIHAALVAGDLEWIRVADPEAGRVDDIQIGRPGRLDAYQIKWGEYEERVMFLSLITRDGAPQGSQLSLMAQLAEGWTRLSRSEPERDVHVHLIMRASASTADQVVGPTSTSRPFFVTPGPIGQLGHPTRAAVRLRTGRAP